MRRAAGERAAARAVLERLLAGDKEAQRAELEPLAGGTHARSWLATFADGRRAVLRLGHRHANALLDVVTEARAMSAAAAAGIAPAVIAADGESGALLTEYSLGDRWSNEDAHRPANIERLAALLRTLHGLPIELPVFAAERIASRYLAELARHGSELREPKWADELVVLARRYDARFGPTAICHNDLVAANVLDDGGLALVDFEFATRADPLLDVANAAAMNGFDAAEQCALLAAYRGATPGADEIAELAWLVRMVRLMAWFWALLGETRARDRSLYAPYLEQFAARLTRE